MGAGAPFREDPHLTVEGLCVARGGRVLFSDLSLSCGKGEFVELRGANGSGKTSLLRAIAGFLQPRAGRIGFGAIEEPALALHYVGHQNGLKPAASVRAHVRYWAGLFGGGDVEPALERLRLTPLADLPARALSQGQARRLALSRLAVAPRPVWLLDEPAAGLDVNARAMLGELIEAQRQAGGLVLAAVHEPLGPAPSQTLTLGAPA